MTHWTKNIILAVIAVALIQTAALGYMVWDRVSILKNGREVILQTTPIDPRSLFRGDYVILRYEISAIDTAKIKRTKKFKRGDTVYVSLSSKQATEGGRPASWQAIAANHTQPNAGRNIVIIKGKVRSVSRISQRLTPSNPEFPWCGFNCQRLNIHYGIESYFVPEGTGKALEEQRDTGNIFVIVKIAKNGNAAIAGLNIDGKTTIVEPLL